MLLALTLALSALLNFSRPVPVFAHHFSPPRKIVVTKPTLIVSSTSPQILTPILPPDPTPSPVSTPAAPISAPTPSNNISLYLLDAVNNYRISQNLSPVKSDPYTCDFAKIRTQEISQNFNHDGFNSRIQNHTLPYPSYTAITENIAMNSDYKAVVPAWINSPGHAANMRADTPNVCIAYTGNFYVYEGWKP